MSFVMPSKYGANLPLPKDPSVRIKEVPKKVVAVVAFSGLYVLCLLKGVHDLIVNKKIRKINKAAYLVVIILMKLDICVVS